MATWFSSPWCKCRLNEVSTKSLINYILNSLRVECMNIIAHVMYNSNKAMSSNVYKFIELNGKNRFFSWHMAYRTKWYQYCCNIWDIDDMVNLSQMHHHLTNYRQCMATATRIEDESASLMLKFLSLTLGRILLHEVALVAGMKPICTKRKNMY